ncbi:copper chaperone PCu(A)C [Zoogloea sp.]|uniref:copper chaperone PCu(A)C n=1 Tax=Zoogloea sp. TaxID=49181 RepID=UPI002CAB6B62|nr:copper chaperone PCu(A)C [Zoogloea sp.]HNB63985.1 copper chaperone PCu(A)C [Rhodocyclaceae bacterium]HNH16505.1 copper chaperone PCu(A)C [Zoogloea sp.]
MRHARMLALLVGTMMMAGAAMAADVEVRDAWVRGVVPAQKSTGAFMQLTSPAGATLVGAASPAAAKVELHEMAMEGNVMRMRPVPRLALAPGQTVALKPGGYHVMLIGLKKPLVDGDKVPLTLLLEGRDKQVDKVEVSAEVRPLTAAAMDEHHHHH